MLWPVSATSLCAEMPIGDNQRFVPASGKDGISPYLNCRGGAFFPQLNTKTTGTAESWPPGCLPQQPERIDTTPSRQAGADHLNSIRYGVVETGMIWEASGRGGLNCSPIECKQPPGRGGCPLFVGRVFVVMVTVRLPPCVSTSARPKGWYHGGRSACCRRFAY